MLRWIHFFATKSIFSNLILILVFVFGIFSVFKIKRELFPNVNFDLITIGTLYPGASPSEIEKLITNPLEQELKKVDGIRTIKSHSLENKSQILLELDPDEADLKEVQSEIQEVVDRFHDLPEGAEEPAVESIESQLVPIIEIALFGEIPEERKRKAARTLEKKIEALSEVARVTFQGFRDYEIKVEVYPEKLKFYDVSLEDVITALKLQNYSIPGGTIQQMDGKQVEEILLRTKGDFENKEDIQKTIVRSNALAEVIRIQDVARVSLDFEEAKNYFKVNGFPSINLTILKKESADAIKLVDQVKKVTDLFFKESKYKELLKGLQYEYVNDNSYLIKRRLKVLLSNLALGLGLIFIILSFVLSWRVSLVVGIGIPFSVFGTLICFYFLNLSINLITLMGLIIVIGMLVDDAIVVIENAQRHVEEGVEFLQASILGAREMMVPVVASISTSILAFLPLMFMSGIFGKMVKFIPMGVIIALLMSLLECFFLLPHHFHQWGIPRKKFRKKGLKKAQKAPQRKNFLMSQCTLFYLKILDQILKLRWVVIFLTFCFFIFSIYFAVKKMRFVLFPKGGIETFIINAETPIGTPLEETLKRVKILEQEVEKMSKEEVKNFVTKIGIQQVSVMDPKVQQGSRFAQIVVYLTPFTQRNRTSFEILESLRKKVGLPEGFKDLSFFEERAGPPVGKPIDIGIRGEEYGAINKALLDLKEKLSQIEGVLDLKSTLVMGKREIQVEVDEAEMSASGLNIFQIGRTIRASFEGIVATRITQIDEEIDVRVSLFNRDQTYKDPESTILNLSVPSSIGRHQIPLKNILSLKRSQSIASYDHENNERQVSLRGELDSKKTSSREVNAEVKKIIKKIQGNHPLVSFHFGGEDRDTKESLQTLLQSFLIAIMLIAMVLILTFQSLWQPLLVLSSVPIGIIAVIWTFYFHDLFFGGYPLSFLSMMGIIAVSGVIVNNAIVFIDFVNKKQKEKFSFFESIKLAGKYRIRPILLTTITTSAGLLPTAYGLGGLDPFVVPIALALGWGILFGAFLTTVILPASMGVLYDVRSFIKRRIS